MKIKKGGTFILCSNKDDNELKEFISNANIPEASELLNKIETVLNNNDVKKYVGDYEACFSDFGSFLYEELNTKNTNYYFIRYNCLHVVGKRIPLHKNRVQFTSHFR